MSEHTPLTEAERNGLDFIVHKRAFRSDLARNIALFTAVEQILAARTSTATADTGLRERVLADEMVEHIANWVPLGFTERDPYPNTVEAARAILTALLAALDATAAPTTDTGARDE